MALLAFILTFIVMIEHIYIMILEMFFANTKLAAKTFGVEKELLANKKVQRYLRIKGFIMAFLRQDLCGDCFSREQGLLKLCRFSF